MLWAVADVFTLLAAATRAADNIAGPAGGFSKHPKARTPESLSEIIVSLPAETLALSRGSELNSAAAGADEHDEDEGGEATGRRSGKSRGRGGREGGGGDPMGQCGLLSPASALVFVNEFLEWAASETGKSPAKLVAQGWDGGIGVWLGLIHSVHTLVRALRNATGESVGMHREGTGGVSSKGKATTADDGPSAEAIALAIFQLRTAVGTPSAALDVLDPSAAGVKPPLSHDGQQSAGASSSSLADGGCVAGNTTSGAHDADPPDVRRVSRRPQPGTMITGFLKRMSERWKAALPWGLPSAAPPRRASPRLERRSGRRGGGGGGGFGGENAPKSLKTEAEDLFFALRGELLRAERLVLSILLVGPGATLTSRAWMMRAALASARRRSGEEAVGAVGLGGLRPPPVALVEAGAPRVRANDPTEVSRRPLPTGEKPPESGSGPARAAPKVNGGNARPIVLKVTAQTGDGGACAAAAGERELGRQPSGDEKVGRGKRGFFAGGAEEELYLDGLGSLCRLAATEMREGLEDGLSVKLSQAYLDLIELLGNAALQHQHHARPTPTTSSESLAVLGTAAVPRLCAEQESQQTTAGSSSTQSNGDIASGDRLEEDNGDAGGVLLSIVTCHTVTQPSLFKRLISGGVRFNGVGVIRHLRASRTAAVTLATLKARDHELSRTVVGHGRRKVINSVEPCPGRSNDGSGAKDSETLRATPPSPPPPLERSSRLMVHCVRWIRARHGSRRGRATIHLFEEDGGESSEEPDVGASGGASVEEGHTDGYGNSDDDVGLPERESDAPQSRYSFRPEDVKFASARECFVAMRAALVECEAALSSASSGLDVRGGGGRSTTDGDLADVVATVSFGLREFFAPAVVTAAQTTKRTATRRKQKEAAADSVPVAATVAGPLSTSAPAVQVGEHNSGGCKTTGTAGGASPLAALDVFPDTTKLLLMRVLERLYLVSRGLTLTASSALAKTSSVIIATVGKAQAASPAQTPAPPPLSSSSPSPLPSKRRRQQRAAANAGKPGDQAGGAPAKTPTKECEASAAERRRGDGGPVAVRAILAANRPSPHFLRSRSVSSSSARQVKGSLQGDLDNGADASSSGASELSTPGSATRVPVIPHGPVNPLLAPLLPAAALASGDGLHLMLAARIWAEALRSRTPRGGDDPCRKRVSRVVTKQGETC